MMWRNVDIRTMAIAEPELSAECYWELLQTSLLQLRALYGKDSNYYRQTIEAQHKAHLEFGLYANFAWWLLSPWQHICIYATGGNRRKWINLSNQRLRLHGRNLTLDEAKFNFVRDLLIEEKMRARKLMA